MDIFLTPKFPVGGMENWGLMVLHSETVRLSNAGDVTLPMTIDQSANSGSGSASSSKEERQREQQQQTLIAVDRLAEQYRVEKVITHELVHQWLVVVGAFGRERGG
jgi:aminopeptidase N